MTSSMMTSIKRLRIAKIFLPVAFLLLVWRLDAFAQTDAAVPQPTGATVPEPTNKAVSDFAGLLTEPEQESLARKVRQFYDSTSTQLAIITVPVAWRGDEATESYSIKLAEKWKIGTRESDNGILFLVIGSPSDVRGRSVRFEVGYGLEGRLTDALSKRIQTELVVPALKAQRYFDAIDKGTDAIIAAVRGEFVAPVKKPRTRTDGGGAGGILLFVIIIVVIVLVMNFRNRGGGRGGRGGGFFSPPLIIGGWGGNSWGGSSAGSSGGGSWNDGGFGGGGGDFGGGGASSDW